MMSSTEHQKMVKKIIDEFESKGLKIVCADYAGYDTCEETDGYIPDVRAKDIEQGLNYIGEAETCDTVNSTHTKKQIQAFSERTMKKGKSKGKTVPFYIAVPNECKDDLGKILKELNLASGKGVFRW